MTRLAPAIALALLLPGSASAQPPRFELELEGGAAWQSYNDVQIPNNESGTRFSLYDLAGSGPFSLTESGVPEAPIRFAGADYAAAEPVEATYTFN